MRGFRAAALTSALTAALVLAGCGDGDSTRRPTSGNRTPGPCVNCSHAEDPMARGPYLVHGATRGGTVTVLTDHGLDGTLDPSGASDPAAVSILSGLVTRSLTQYRYDPRSRQMVLVPDLATDLGEHNDDYTKWIYRVRQGIRFEDGSRVRALDVARGVRRCLHDRPFPASPCLDNGPIRSVQVRRHNELLFHFDRPFPDLPYLAATPALGPVPRGTAAVSGPYARHPLATGPYRIQDYRRGHRLVLVRNSEWDPATDTTRTQYPDRYVVRAGISRTHTERLLIRDEGSAEATLTLDDVRAEPFERARSDSQRLVLGGKPCTTYLAPDNRTITDPRVRRALIWAYPYRAALRAEGLVRGVTAVPATNLEPPGLPGRTTLEVPHHRGFAHQPRVARRMLTKAHALGTRLRFLYDPRDLASIRLRDALVRSLRASGFDPQPERGPAGLHPGRTPANLPVDLRTTTRCGAWPSGAQWLDPVYRSTRPGRTGNLLDNTEAFSRPAVEHRMDAISRQPFDRQSQSWNRLDRTVLGRWQPVVPLWYGGVSMAHGSRIRGMDDDDLLGMPTWGRIWVSASS